MAGGEKDPVGQRWPYWGCRIGVRTPAESGPAGLPAPQREGAAKGRVGPFVFVVVKADVGPPHRVEHLRPDRRLVLERREPLLPSPQQVARRQVIGFLQRIARLEEVDEEAGPCLALSASVRTRSRCWAVRACWLSVPIF